MPISISNLTATGDPGNLTVNYDATLTNDAPASPPASLPFVTVGTLGITRRDFTAFLGMKITMGAADKTVGALGRWVFEGNSRPHQIVLLDAGGAVLGSVTVDTAGATPGRFLYASLATPVRLLANRVYYVLSAEISGQDAWGNVDMTVTTTSAAVLSDGAYISGTTLGAVPTPGGGPPPTLNHPFGPVDFKYSS